MRIAEGNICPDCSNFEHECPYGGQDPNEDCIEYCLCKDEEVVKRFYFGEFHIKECKGFKNKDEK